MDKKRKNRQKQIVFSKCSWYYQGTQTNGVREDMKNLLQNGSEKQQIENRRK